MDPQFYNAYMQLGLIYDEIGDETALQYFNNALRIGFITVEKLNMPLSYFYQQK
ncbi:MAG: hypothetical protein R2836_10000 [Chitinophagales bacterium]